MTLHVHPITLREASAFIVYDRERDSYTLRNPQWPGVLASVQEEAAAA